MMSRSFLLALAASNLALLACSTPPDAGGFAPGSGSSGSNPGGSSGTFGGSTSSSSGATNGDDCSESAKLVYVVTSENELYSFKPDTLTFTRIGELQCNAGGATPNSMAVDRNGTAWVNYNNGTLWKVSTTNASCQSTSFSTSVNRVGMAFASNAANSKDETLFVVHFKDGAPDKDGLGLYSVDLSTLKEKSIGDFSGSLRQQGAELTGTGNGELFGFFTTTPANLAAIDKATAATPSPQSLASVSTENSFAFSYWGGDFWLYTATAGSSSKVTRVKASTDNSVSVVKSNLGFSIVGAGVSTCAPTTFPK
jgi:hypothetical protein